MTRSMKAEKTRHRITIIIFFSIYFPPVFFLSLVVVVVCGLTDIDAQLLASAVDHPYRHLGILNSLGTKQKAT